MKKRKDREKKGKKERKKERKNEHLFNLYFSARFVCFCFVSFGFFFLLNCLLLLFFSSLFSNSFLNYPMNIHIAPLCFSFDDKSLKSLKRAKGKEGQRPDPIFFLPE